MVNKVATRANAFVFRAFNQVLQANSNSIFRPVLKTPPIFTNTTSDTVLYTLLDQRNYCSYILAAKSFLRFCPNVRVVVQSDGTLSSSAAKDILDHLPGAAVLHRRESVERVREAAPPELICQLVDLERCHVLLLLKLLSVVFGLRGKRLIFMDSDLLFLRKPNFVVDWVDGRDDSSFYSDGGSRLATPFHEMGFNFVNVDITDFNSGFMGFLNDVDVGRLCEIIDRICKYDRTLLLNWEIEQAIWSVLFNGFTNPINLDNVEKDYVASGYWPLVRIKKSVLAHFVGSVRFRNLSYPRLARMVVSELKSNDTESLRGSNSE